MAPSSNSKLRKSVRSKKAKSYTKVTIKEHDIPYFAHQLLDPELYQPYIAVTLPVGKPGWAPAPKEIATATNGGWDDDLDAPIEEDLNDENSTLTPVASTKSRHHIFSNDSKPYKRMKVAGGRPAIAKKVVADLDSDDELIVRMKNAKYLEKDIAQRLQDEGRIKYNPKTIGTRWARLKKVLAQRNDELLDADATDWHDGDDEALHMAIQKATEITEKAKQDAERRKWRHVADQLKAIKPVTNFSQNACQQRYEALQAGTAKPTPESLASPDEKARKAIASRKAKERRIELDSMLTGMGQEEDSPLARQNLQANGWNSRQAGS